MQALPWNFNVGLTSVHQIIHETCQAIWNKLSIVNLATPSTQSEWIRIEKGFRERWNFPHCIGASHRR